MKKILILCLLFLVGKFSSAQYPVTQYIGSDSTIVTSKGGLRSLGGIVNGAYTDTAAANLTRIRQYAGAQIFTAGGQLWVRNVTATKWILLSSSSGGVNIYNTDGAQTSPVRTFSGYGGTGSTDGTLIFQNLDSLWLFNNTQVLISPLQSGEPTDSILTWNQNTGQIRKVSPNNLPGSCATQITQLDSTHLLITQCPSKKVDTITFASAIYNYYFFNDTSIVVCYDPQIACYTIPNLITGDDSVVCNTTLICDTISASGGTAVGYVFQNGLVANQRIAEQGGTFNKNTSISGQNLYNFKYDDLNFSVRGVWGSGARLDTLFGSQFSFVPSKGSIYGGYYKTYGNIGQSYDSIGVFSQNFGVNNITASNYTGAFGGISNENREVLAVSLGGNNNKSYGSRGTTVGGQSNLITSAGYTGTIIGGAGNINAAHYSLNSGYYTQQYTMGGTVLGTFPDTLSKANAASSSIRIAQGRIFAVGNGSSYADRKNAFTLFNGDTKGARAVISGATYRAGAVLDMPVDSLAVGMPSGSTGQMNAIASPRSGDLYWNTDSLALCEYINGYGWLKVDRNSSSGGSGNPNSNIGSGYRWAVPNTNNIKTVFVTGGLTIDSTTNSNALTFGISSNSITDSTAFYRLRNLNDSTTVFDRRNGTSDTLVIANNGGSGGGGGSITLAAFGSSPNVYGATISGSVLNLQPASSLYGGGVSTTTQTFAGTKTFVQDIYVRNSIRIGRGAGDIVTNFVASPDGLSSNTTGFQNLSIGYLSMAANTTGGQNIALGYQTLQNNTTGGVNIAIGSSSMKQNTTGSQNVSIGHGALQNNTTGQANVAVGISALSQSTYSYRNTAVGYAAMNQSNLNAYDNAAFGFNALTALTSGIKNTAIGSAAMEETTTGYQNVAIGQDAMLHNTTGYANVAAGWLAGALNVTGYDNISIGWSSQRSVASGRGNIAIGSSTMYNASQVATVNNSIAIGDQVYTTASNQIKIGNSSNTSIYLRGTLYWNDDPGTAGYVLTSQGAGLPAIWTASGGGGGGVAAVSATDANGFDFTVTNPTTTPNISLTTTVGNSRVVYSSSGAVTGAAGFTFDGTSAITLGVNGSSIGKTIYRGSTSGSVTLQPAAAAGSWTLTLPTSAGTNGYFLQTDGAGNTSWAAVSGSGTVTSVDVSGGTTGLTTTGGPVTSTGTITIGGTLITSNGGTGLSSYTQGDLLYYNSGTTLSKLAKSTTANQFLSNGGTSNNPSWATITASMIGSAGNLTDVDDTNVTLTTTGGTGATLTNTTITAGWTGTLAATRGGTGNNSYSVGDILYANSTTTLAKRPAGAEGYVLTIVGGVPAWTASGGGGGGTNVPISSLLSANAVNDIDNRGRIQVWRWDSLTSYGLRLMSNSSATNAQGSSVLSVEVSGVHTLSNSLSAAADFSNTHTGTNSVNYGIIAFASGASKENYAMVTNAKVGIMNDYYSASSDVLSLGSVLQNTTGSIGFYGKVSGHVTVKSKDTAGTWTLTLPDNDGTANQVLTTDGNGVTSWTTVAGGGGGTVSSFDFTNGNGFTGSVTNATTTPTLALTTSVTTGRVIYASSGAITGDAGMTYDGGGILSLGATGSLLGQISLYGNTAGRVLVRPAASFSNWTLTLPTSAGTNGYFLKTDGTGATSWAAGNAGTVTSVDVSGGTTGMTYSGGPVTTSGTITMAGTLITSNGGTGISSWSQGDIPYYTSGTALSKLAKSTTANQVLMNSGTSNAPAWASITAAMVGSGAALTKTDDTNVTLTLGGSPSTSLLAATSLTLGWTGTLGATRGGTGTGTVATGDILYGSGVNTWSKLGIGSTNQVLTVVGGVPTWQSLTSGITASNGLTLSSSDVKLGGTLTQNTTIDGSTAYNLRLTGNYTTSTADAVLKVTQSSTNGRAVYVDAQAAGTAGIYTVSSSGTAIQGTATSGYGIAGIVTTGTGGEFQATSGIGVNAFATTGLPLQAWQTASATSTVTQLFQIIKQTSGTPANGIGASIDFSLQSSGGNSIANQLISKWTDVTFSSRTSQFIVTGVNSATTADLLTISGNGRTKLNKYGVGSFTGSSAYLLGVDASGNIVETTASSGFSVRNGLNVYETGVGELGGSLVRTTFVDGASYSYDLYFDNLAKFQAEALNVQLTATSSGIVKTTGKIAWDSDISPSTITGQVDNYNPTGFSSASVLRITSNDGVISGIAGGSDGRIINMVVLGSSSSWVKILNQSTSSTAANRFDIGVDRWIRPGDGVQFWYDETSQRWRILDINSNAGNKTTGTVLFADANAIQSDDNFYWDNAFKRLGIGTNVPGATLEVTQSAPEFYIGNFYNQSAGGNGLQVGVNSISDGDIVFNAYSFSGGVLDRFTIMANGEIKIGGSAGSAYQALVSNGSGSAASWETVVFPNEVQTLTNKSITPRIGSNTSSATPTPNASFHDQYDVTNLAVDATFGDPTGSPVNGQRLTIRVKSNSSAHALGWGSSYRGGSTIALPTTTSANSTQYCVFIYNSQSSTWDLISYNEF